jgi:hypothetical protein
MSKETESVMRFTRTNTKMRPNYFKRTSSPPFTVFHVASSSDR